MVPAYCHACGSAYPWTAQRIVGAHELADALHRLTPRERELLKRSIDELIADGPQTELAIVRFKTLIAKAGGEAAVTFREILIHVVSEAVRRAIWGA
jgi:hypothetical protein